MHKNGKGHSRPTLESINIEVKKEDSLNAVDGHKVVVELLDKKDNHGGYYGKVTEIIGHKNDPGVDISTLKHIPTRGYSEYISFMNNKFQSTFGSENYYQLNTSHGNVPNAALNMDENNDNKSDLVEWMLTQQK